MKQNLVLTALLTIFSSYAAFAIRFQNGDQVRIDQPVYEDIYIAGGNITIAAMVHGDVYCAGGTITISDSITGDLVVAGGQVYMRGVVVDDVRAAGGTVDITGNIGGDLVVAGGTVVVSPETVISNALSATSGKVDLMGTVRGITHCSGGEINFSGRAEQDFNCYGGKLMLNGFVGGASTLAGQDLNLGSQSSFNGNVRYWSGRGEMDFGTALASGTTATYDASLGKDVSKKDYRFLGFASFMFLLWYVIAMFILLALGQWLFARFFSQGAATAQSDPLRSIGYGFLYFVVVPVAILLLMITLVGVPIGLVALFIYLILLGLANVITALLGANWLNMRSNNTWKPFRIILVALALLIVLKLLMFVPILGWLVKIITVFLAFGALLLNIEWPSRKKNSTTAV